MATGTGNLPNPGMSFTPFDILTAAEQNDLVENIESLADGTGIGDGSVDTAAIADEAVTSDKIDWTTLGWVDYNPTPTGFSSVPTGAIYRYLRLGNTVTVHCHQTLNGTSNANFFTIPAPFTAITKTNAEWGALVPTIVNNGAVPTTPGLAVIASGESAIRLYTNSAGATWNTSGGKRILDLMITYECAP